MHRGIRNVLGLRLTNLTRESRDVGSPVTTDGGPLQRTYGAFYDGKYDGLIVAVEKRFRKRYQVMASYTYSKATDNLLNSNLGLGLGAQGGGAVPTDNLEFDRGDSDLLVPHVLVLSGIVSLPAGFRLSGVFRATSGVHFTAVGPPTDYDGDGIVSTPPPGTRRNQFTGPASRNLDLRLERQVVPYQNSRRTPNWISRPGGGTRVVPNLGRAGPPRRTHLRGAGCGRWRR